MNRLVLVLGILLFLMSFTSVKAIQIFNLTGQVANILNTGNPTPQVFKQRMFCDINYCYHAYQSRDGSNNRFYIDKWQKNTTNPFGVLLQTVGGGSASAKLPKSWDVMDYDNEKFYMITQNGTGYLKRYWVYKTNLSLVEDTDVPSKDVSFTMLEMALANNFDIVYTNDTSNDDLTPRTINKLYYTTGYINSTIESFFDRPQSISYIYVPETQESYLFFVNGSLKNSAKAYIYRFDNMYNLITYYPINTGNVIDKRTFLPASFGYEPLQSLYSYYYNGIIYFAIRQDSPNNNTWYINAIDPVKTHEQNQLIYSGGSGQYLDLSLYDSLIGNSSYHTDNQTTAFSFYYDDSPTKEQWYILYHRQNAMIMYGGEEIMYILASKSCLCSEWVNVSSCGYYMPNAQYQTRSCNPYQCDSIGQYIDCIETSPTINQKKSSQCGVCSTGEKIPQDTPQSKCSISIEIPTNATNIKSNATWSIGVSSPFSFTSQDLPNYYRLIVCNPTENCFDQEYYCSQINVSQTQSYDNYQAGQIATSEFGIDQASSCKLVRKWLADIGWSKYTVYGQLCINYNVTCGGWICASTGLNDYLQYENPDCSREPINSSNICINGCENNQCLTEPSQTQQQENIGQSIGSPVGSLISMSLISMDAMFTSSDSKIVGATIITLCVGIGITLIFKSEKGIIFGIISMLPIFFFFAIRGYYPIWITLLVAIPSVAFIVVLLSGLKHTQGG